MQVVEHDVSGRAVAKRRPTRTVQAGDLLIGGQHPISVQSMCATHTQDVEATSRQINMLHEHGADLVRVAVDSKRDVEALSEIRPRVKARLVVDLQENYRLVEAVAPLVQKVRYNPGHLHHHQKDVPVFDKVRFIVECARRHDCAVRIGVNFGSLDRNHSQAGESAIETALASIRQHAAFMSDLKFENWLVSIKSSDPRAVLELNRRFAVLDPATPLHLGVTDAGMLPMGETKTRFAFERLLLEGIGDTLRVSLTLPHEKKYEEVELARRIIADVQSGRAPTFSDLTEGGLNIISCPSCSRVENEAFVELAASVREMAAFAADYDITIAVMGCRVNGPGETDSADLGLWCAPGHVNLKRGGTLLGAFGYDLILPRVREELEALIAAKHND